VVIESSAPNYSDKVIQPTATTEPVKSTRNTENVALDCYGFTVLPDRTHVPADTDPIDKLSLAPCITPADDAY